MKITNKINNLTAYFCINDNQFLCVNNSSMTMKMSGEHTF